MLERGHSLQAVFFREEGVYNSVMGTATDSGTPQLAESWAQLSAQHGIELLVCQSSSKRRLTVPFTEPFREAGLVEFVDRLASCDRVMTF